MLKMWFTVRLFESHQQCGNYKLFKSKSKTKTKDNSNKDTYTTFNFISSQISNCLCLFFISEMTNVRDVCTWWDNTEMSYNTKKVRFTMSIHNFLQFPSVNGSTKKSSVSCCKAPHDVSRCARFPKNALRKDIIRTIEIPQHTRLLKANHCLKVHNIHLRKETL